MLVADLTRSDAIHASMYGEAPTPLPAVDTQPRQLS